VSYSHLDPQLELVIGSVQTQPNEKVFHVHPSIISTLPFLIPSWVTALQTLQCDSRMIQQVSDTHMHYSTSNPSLRHPVSSQLLAAKLVDDRGITSVSQTLETQFPPVSPEFSPMRFEAETQFSAPRSLLHFSDDDDVMPNIAWHL
jgi:hypothetical protein